MYSRLESEYASKILDFRSTCSKMFHKKTSPKKFCKIYRETRAIEPFTFITVHDQDYNVIKKVDH